MANVLGLYDGCSCGQQALQRAKLKVDKYYASEIDKYAIQITQKNFPDTIQLGDIYNIDYSQFSQIDLILGGSPCFVAGTKILTNCGYKNIEDVCVGDLVLTHKNRFMPVICVGNEIKEIIKLDCEGMLSTNTTDNHPYYVREMNRVWDNKKRSFVRAWSKPKWKTVEDISKNDYIGIPIMQEETNEENFTEEECWLFGRYVADGHLRKDKRRLRKNSYQYQVIFSIGKDKVEHFKSKVKKNHFSCYTHTKSTYRCVISSMELLNKIQKLNLGVGAVNKRIPIEILKLPKKLLNCFIEGYLSGDGYVKENVVTASTISKELAIGFSLAIAKLYRVSCGVIENKVKPTTVIEGRVVNQSQSYTMTFRKEKVNQSHFIELENIIWCPFKKKECKAKDVVYNISVAEDESYTANNVIVHNCTHWSIAKKDREITSEGIGFDLFMQYANAVKKLKPKYFLYENNHSIHKDIKDAITKELGVDFIMINSSLVSAQNRRRCYWTNIPGVQQPEDKHILLKDILENGITEKDKSFCVDASYYKGGNLKMHIEKSKRTQIFEPVRLGQIGKGGQGNRIYSVKGKSICLSANGGGRGAKTGLYKIDLPDGDYFIRKLTPIECERLQTMKDGYTEGVSNSQRYKMIGNGWTIEVIAHILGYIPRIKRG